MVDGLERVNNYKASIPSTEIPESGSVRNKAGHASLGEHNAFLMPRGRKIFLPLSGQYNGMSHSVPSIEKIQRGEPPPITHILSPALIPKTWSLTIDLLVSSAKVSTHASSLTLHNSHGHREYLYADGVCGEGSSPHVHLHKYAGAPHQGNYRGTYQHCERKMNVD